jgi:predicted transcriptional regulator
MSSKALKNDEKIMSALFIRDEIHGEEESDSTEIAAAAGISKATYAPLISRMKKAGVIANGSAKGKIRLTENGKDRAAGLVDKSIVVSTNAEYHETHLRPNFKGTTLKIFNILADGNEHRKEDIMAKVDCTNPKTFNPLFSRNFGGKTGMTETGPGGMVKLAAKCFPFKK